MTDASKNDQWIGDFALQEMTDASKNLKGETYINDMFQQTKKTIRSSTNELWPIILI